MQTSFSEYTSHRCNENLPAHRHTDAYIAIVLEGAYDELSADGVWACEPGDIVVHPPYHLHTNRFGSRNTHVLNIPYGTHLRYGVFRPSCPDDLIRFRSDPEQVELAVATATVCEQSLQADWVEDIASDLRNNSRLPVGVAARRQGKTPEHAARVFSQRFGFSPVTYRLEHRLQCALQMLRDSSCTIMQVADQAGYSDQAHMSRHLHAATGQTPRAIRQQ